MRNCGFVVTEVGVGGIDVVVPIAKEALAGDVGRRERVCVSEGPG